MPTREQLEKESRAFGTCRMEPGRRRRPGRAHGQAAGSREQHGSSDRITHEPVLGLMLLQFPALQHQASASNVEDCSRS
jgi:hypothetical protein